MGPSQLEIAENFLRAALDAGPRLSADISTLATKCQISERTLSRARSSLGVETKEVWESGKSAWVMFFPRDETRIQEIWQSGRQGQNSGQEVINKLDKLLELNEKLVNRLGVQGVGVQAPLMTQDAKLSPRYETIENGGKPVSISAAEITKGELNQFYRAVNVLKNAGKWERKSWLAWANEWLYSNGVRGGAVVN